jgi:hypothetical protein
LERRWLTLSACWLAGLFIMVSAQAETYHVASGNRYRPHQAPNNVDYKL